MCKSSQMANDRTMIWAADLDVNGTAMGDLATSTGQMIKREAKSSVSDSVGACQWSDCINGDAICPGLGGYHGGYCGGSCPDSTNPVLASTDMGCTGNSYRAFCCPQDNQPSCRATKSVGFNCDGACLSDEVQIGASYDGCFFGENALCCKRSASTQSYGTCGKLKTTICYNSIRRLLTRLLARLVEQMLCQLKPWDGVPKQRP